MSLLLFAPKRFLTSAILMASPLLALGQAAPEGGEYSLNGAVVGDQVRPGLSLNQDGGYMVWEQNGNLKTGLEIYAMKLDSTLNKVSEFRVNRTPKGDQMNPQVQLFQDGSALFAWQGYGLRDSDIYVRSVTGDGRLGREIRLNTYKKDQQSEPVLTPLKDGGAMVAWQSFGQDGSMFGVYLRKVSGDGKVERGTEILANQTTAFNQRTPSIATLQDGNVVVAWISEQQRFVGSVDLYARLFTPEGTPVTGELLLNSANNLCANPAIASLPGGGFTVVWSQKDLENSSNSWDIVGRSFDAQGTAAGADFKINSHTYGDQYRPKIANVGADCAVVWTSLGQDGSREGVYGRILQGGLQPSGEEFRVNTRTISRQIYPNIAFDNAGRFLVAWSSFVAITGFDLFGQKYTLTPQP